MNFLENHQIFTPTICNKFSYVNSKLNTSAPCIGLSCLKPLPNLIEKSLVFHAGTSDYFSTAISIPNHSSNNSAVNNCSVSHQPHTHKVIITTPKLGGIKSTILKVITLLHVILINIFRDLNK